MIKAINVERKIREINLLLKTKTSDHYFSLSLLLLSWHSVHWGIPLFIGFECPPLPVKIGFFIDPPKYKFFFLNPILSFKSNTNS